MSSILRWRQGLLWNLSLSDLLERDAMAKLCSVYSRGIYLALALLNVSVTHPLCALSLFLSLSFSLPPSLPWNITEGIYFLLSQHPYLKAVMNPSSTPNQYHDLHISHFLCKMTIPSAEVPFHWMNSIFINKDWETNAIVSSLPLTIQSSSFPCV